MWRAQDSDMNYLISTAWEGKKKKEPKENICVFYDSSKLISNMPRRKEYEMGLSKIDTKKNKLNWMFRFS